MIIFFELGDRVRESPVDTPTDPAAGSLHSGGRAVFGVEQDDARQGHEYKERRTDNRLSAKEAEDGYKTGRCGRGRRRRAEPLLHLTAGPAAGPPVQSCAYRGMSATSSASRSPSLAPLSPAKATQLKRCAEV